MYFFVFDKLTQNLTLIVISHVCYWSSHEIRSLY